MGAHGTTHPGSEKVSKCTCKNSVVGSTLTSCPDCEDDQHQLHNVFYNLCPSCRHFIPSTIVSTFLDPDGGCAVRCAWNCVFTSVRRLHHTGRVTHSAPSLPLSSLPFLQALFVPSIRNPAYPQNQIPANPDRTQRSFGAEALKAASDLSNFQVQSILIHAGCVMPCLSDDSIQRVSFVTMAASIFWSSGPEVSACLLTAEPAR